MAVVGAVLLIDNTINEGVDASTTLVQVNNGVLTNPGRTMRMPGITSIQELGYNLTVASTSIGIVNPSSGIVNRWNGNVEQTRIGNGIRFNIFSGSLTGDIITWSSTDTSDTNGSFVSRTVTHAMQVPDGYTLYRSTVPLPFGGAAPSGGNLIRVGTGVGRQEFSRIFDRFDMGTGFENSRPTERVVSFDISDAGGVFRTINSHSSTAVNWFVGPYNWSLPGHQFLLVPIMRTITWNPNGGTWTGTNPAGVTGTGATTTRTTSVQQGSTPPVPTTANFTLTRSGFTFAHWDPALTPAGTEDRTHTARWNRTITRNYGGAGNTFGMTTGTTTQHLLVGSQHTIAATGAAITNLSGNPSGSGNSAVRFLGWNTTSLAQANAGTITPGWAVGNTVTIAYTTPANIWPVYEWVTERTIVRALANSNFPETTTLTPMTTLNNIRRPGNQALGTPTTAQTPHGFRFIGWASTWANQLNGIADLGTTFNVPLNLTTEFTVAAVWERDTNIMPNFPDPLPPHIEQGWWIIRLNFTGGISTESFVETRFYDPNPSGTTSRTLPTVVYMNTWASTVGNDFNGRTFLGWFTTRLLVVNRLP